MMMLAVGALEAGASVSPRDGGGDDSFDGP